jgi:choline dehydrogenase-like flavoprotein
MIQRDWQLSPDYVAVLKRAITQLVDRLGHLVISVNLFSNWETTLETGAHHSGTARMAASPAEGVCNANAGVYGLPNLFIADGSVIPGSGIANTGLTIAALGLRLAKHLRTIFPLRVHPGNGTASDVIGHLEAAVAIPSIRRIN